MQGKEKNIKSICTKIITPEIPLPADKVAEIAGVSQSLVKKIRRGMRNKNTPAGSRVEVTQNLWAEGSNKLINAIKEIVKL